MAIGVNTQTSLRLIGALNKGAELLGRTYERLSSGMRITRSSDDTAGLAISTVLNAHTRVLSQAARNISDGVSFFSVADSALAQLSAITQRQGELAEQAANGSLSVAQRRVLSKEANALVDEFNRITQVTQFNNIAPLAQNGALLGIQADIGSAGGVLFSVGGEIDRSTGLGTIASQSSTGTVGMTNFALADFNRDGKLDVAITVSGGESTDIRLGNGDGTFSGVIGNLADSSCAGIAAGDFTGDGIADLVTTNPTTAYIFKGVGNGTFTSAGTIATSVLMIPYLMEQSPDGISDLVLASFTEQRFYQGNGNGTFGPASVRSVAVGDDRQNIAADFNNDGTTDLLAAGAFGNQCLLTLGGPTSFGSTVVVQQADLLGSFGALCAADFNLDGNMDYCWSSSVGNSQVQLGRGDGTFSLSSIITINGPLQYTAAGDMNGDGLPDLVFSDGATLRVGLGNGDGTFKPLVQSAVTASLTDLQSVSDLNGDGVGELIGQGGSALGVGFQHTRQTANMPYLNLSTVSGARAAMSLIETTRARINLEQSVVGAQLSRLSSAASVTGAKLSEFQAGAERITSVDVAQEAAQLVRVQILQQTTSALIAQSNLDPRIALDLIRGV